MRALGIDFGEQRIGLAISDPEGRFALPLETLERQTDRRAAHAIAAIARREDVGVLVLGEPLGLGGEVERGQVERVRRFGARLKRAARLPVVRIDETLTSVEAEARLAETDPRREERRRDGRCDAVAAQVLLQEALDRGMNGPAPGRTDGEAP